MVFSDDFICEVKEKNEITEVISNYTTLVCKGRNYVGLCPFHSEKTGSFFVYPESKSFYCFGCNVGGDIITFLKLAENFDYYEAVKYLCDRSHLKLPISDCESQQAYKKKQMLYKMNKIAARFFFKNLCNKVVGKPAMEYLGLREVDSPTIKKFGIGFAPDDRFTLIRGLEKFGFSDNDILDSNLAVKTKTGRIMSRFYNRVMFPIFDLSGNVIAFGGRVLDNRLPKYLNSSDTAVFKKSENLFLFNIAKKSKKEHVILVEGYMDAVSLAQRGFDNVVASLGTALTLGQVKLIARYFKNVAICYDSDEAGQRASLRASEMFRSNGISVKIINITGAKDPDEFLRKHKESALNEFNKLIKVSKDDISFKVSSLKKQFDLAIESEKITFLNKCAKILANIESEIELGSHINTLCNELNFPKELLFKQIQKLKSSGKKGNRLAIRKRLSNENFVKNFEIKLEKKIVSYIIHNIQRSLNAETIVSAINRLDPNMFQDKFCKKIFEVIKSLFRDNLKLDFESIHKSLSDDEVSEFTKIACEFDETLITNDSFQEYISRIIGEHSIKNLKASNVSPSEIQKYILNNRRKFKVDKAGELL